MTLIHRLLAALSICVLAAQAQAFDTRATSAFVVDVNTGTVLLAKNADEPRPPASMSKLMTLYMAFEALRDGRLSMTEELPVSQHAMNYGGSTLFLRAGERVKVEDLIRGIIVLSGNDACAVIAEALSSTGTEAGFARDMTRRARALGMTNSTFTNSNGWPAPGHKMSARDLALLARLLIEDFPEFYPMFAEREFLFDAKESQNRFNRNPLLALDIGVDGLKTGHTREAGYGLVGSAQQGARRVIFVISGLGSERARAEEAEAIVNWAFRQFAERTLVTKGTRLAEAPVFMGASPKVGLVPSSDVRLMLPVLDGNTVTAEVVFDGPLTAPLDAGMAVAELVIAREGLEEVRVPLVTEAAVAEGGFGMRLAVAAQALMARWGLAPAGAS